MIARNTVVKTIVWLSIQDMGDGSASPMWFLTEEDANGDQYSKSSWGEPCVSPVETYEGSNIHKEAAENSRNLSENR